MKVGLFFGSFNPIHMGHLIIANIALNTTDIKQIWFVVSPCNPLKNKKSLLHEFDRLDMVEAAIYDNYDFKTCDIEFNLPQPSYTIHTLAYLSEKYPEHEFKIIIGEDNLSQFKRWKNYQEILNYGLIVYPRPHAEETDLKNHQNVSFIEAPYLDISASLIRKFIKEGKSVKYLLHDEVISFIKRKGFYL